MIYALIAAGLVFWLRSILGTQDGDEPQRPNPYAPSASNNAQKPKHRLEVVQNHEEDPGARIKEIAENGAGGVSIDNKTAENGLLDILKADKKFDIDQFMGGAQDAFVIVVEAFASGDKETLGNLLDKPVYNVFEKAIDARAKSGETTDCEIHAVKKAEIMKAHLDKKMAYIMVRFTADETSVIRDKDDKIISGDPDKTTKMRDMWVFGRSITAKTPAWMVYETRDDLEDDNDLVPNSKSKKD